MPTPIGISVRGRGVDIKKVVERSRKVAAQLNGGVGHLSRRIRSLYSTAGENWRAGPPAKKLTVEKDGKKIADLTASNIVLATGAQARTLPGLEPDGKLIWTYREAMVPESLPKSILVVGSGAIGIEFASFYRNLGAEVTVVEVLDRILPVEDEEISAFAQKAFEKDGMKIVTGAQVKELKKAANPSRQP